MESQCLLVLSCLPILTFEIGRSTHLELCVSVIDSLCPEDPLNAPLLVWHCPDSLSQFQTSEQTWLAQISVCSLAPYEEGPSECVADRTKSQDEERSRASMSIYFLVL